MDKETKRYSTKPILFQEKYIDTWLTNHLYDKNLLILHFLQPSKTIYLTWVMRFQHVVSPNCFSSFSSLDLSLSAYIKNKGNKSSSNYIDKVTVLNNILQHVQGHISICTLLKGKNNFRTRKLPLDQSKQI